MMQEQAKLFSFLCHNLYKLITWGDKDAFIFEFIQYNKPGQPSYYWFGHILVVTRKAMALQVFD
jgi:hypothetical protein